MAKQTINIGAAPNDGTGTPLRTSFDYCNQNFTELYTATGPSGNNIVVPGSATITGDLTVDTSTLKVDSANNRVGIGTATPTAALHVNLAEVSSAAGTSAIITNTTGGGNRIAALRLANLSNQWNIRAYGAVTDDLRFGSGAAGSEVDYLSIGNTGIFTWSNVGGVAGTAMTLNASGLGVGGSPAFKLDVAGAANSAPITLLRLNNNGTTGGGPGIAARLQFNAGSTALGFVQGCNFASGAIGVQISGDGTNIHQTIDSSGNVGVGVTPSASWVTYKALEFDTGIVSGSSSVALNRNCYFDGVNWRYKVTTSFGIAQYQLSGNGNHIWNIASSGSSGAAINGGTGAWTQAMTLDASGRLLVNTTSVIGGSGDTLQIAGKTTAGTDYCSMYTGTSTTVYGSRYYHTSAVVGSITFTASGTAYNIASDYRLKESVQPLTGGLARINALKPSIYKWKVNNSNGEGFIAHELADVVPAAVTGEKDAVNEDGSIKPQQVDLSKIVPVLVAAIQELAAEVNALKNA